MILIDNLFLLPFKGLLSLAKRVQEMVEEETAQEKDSITQELTELYMMLETGQITDEEFDNKESELLDRLDELEAEEKREDSDEKE